MKQENLFVNYNRKDEPAVSRNSYGKKESVIIGVGCVTGSLT